MLTIDTMIKELQNLRERARNGGDTPIVICSNKDYGDLEKAVVFLENAIPTTTSEKTGEVIEWMLIDHSRVLTDDMKKSICSVVRVM